MSDHVPMSRVVIAGGGVAALEAALALRELASELVDVELVAPDADFTYRPLAVAEPFLAGEVRRFPLHALVEAASASLCSARVTGVDPARRIVRTDVAGELEYDALLLALGARSRQAIPGALTFRGPADVPALARLLEEALAGQIHRIVFALPAGVTWPLPVYELALQTRAYLTDRGAMSVELTVATPEEAPLALFGRAGSSELRELLETRGIGLRTHVTPVAFENGALRLVPGGLIEADRVVAAPRLQGPALPGVPSDWHGFVPTDEHGRVGSEVDIYAAGDLTQFPLKQGGIATQQADAAAEAIAAQLGAAIEPAPFRPVLRGLLLTGMVPRYLQVDVGKSYSDVDTEPLWWPPDKISGRYLAPFLAERLGWHEVAPEEPDGRPVEALSFAATPGPGDSEGGDVYSP
jgi:sulfide:quinone oxidoreductase